MYFLISLKEDQLSGIIENGIIYFLENASYTWQSIVSTWELLDKGSLWRVATTGRKLK